jgi:hypothetical protein
VNTTAIALQTPFLPERDVTVVGTLPLGRYAVVPQAFDPDTGVEYTVTIHSKERVNVFAGTEIDWDPEQAALLEGENEMEQDLAKAEELDDAPSFEEDSQIVAIQAAAKMVAELTVLARQLEQKKQELVEKLEVLTAQADKL